MNIGDICTDSKGKSIVVVNGFATEIGTISKNMIIIVNHLIINDKEDLLGYFPSYSEYGTLEQVKEKYTPFTSFDYLKLNYDEDVENWGSIILKKHKEYMSKRGLICEY